MFDPGAGRGSAGDPVSGSRLNSECGSSKDKEQRILETLMYLGLCVVLYPQALAPANSVGGNVASIIAAGSGSCRSYSGPGSLGSLDGDWGGQSDRIVFIDVASSNMVSSSIGFSRLVAALDSVTEAGGNESNETEEASDVGRVGNPGAVIDHGAAAFAPTIGSQTYGRYAFVVDGPMLLRNVMAGTVYLLSASHSVALLSRKGRLHTLPSSFC